MKWVVVAVLSAAAAVAVLWLTGVARLPFAALRPHPAAPQPVLVALPQVTSNLQSSSGVHFVEVTMTVKLQDKADAKALQQHEAAVQDAVLMTLRSQSVSSLNGPAGMSQECARRSLQSPNRGWVMADVRLVVSTTAPRAA